MRGLAGILFLALFGGITCISSATTVRVDNPAGRVTARVVTGRDVQVRHYSEQREVRPTDTRVTKRLGQGLILVDCRPEDGALIHLEIELPYGVEIEVKTKSGAVTLSGMIARARINTETGDVALRAPWGATRVRIDSAQEPESHSLPGNGTLITAKTVSDGERRRWQVRDQLPHNRVTYGSIDVRAKSPGRVTLVDMPIPADSPVKLPWQALGILEDLLGEPPREDGEATTAGPDVSPPSHAEGGEVRFSADVRMVNLMVAVSDRDGRPVTGLERHQFEVLEDGVPQQVAALSSEEVPFNLVLLLDWSGSTERDRESMREAARSFVEVARPQDRVAVYALVGNVLMVASPLTDDRRQLLKEIDQIPDTPGGTPLYDAVVLAYAQELRQRFNERNALLVISDGADNQIRPMGSVFDATVSSPLNSGLPSEVSFAKLTRAAAGMNALIYPILLDPSTGGARPAQDWMRLARDRMSELASVSGGRLFSARSLRDLTPVYPRVVRELRSVYGLGYYPRNQTFDGAWRKIRVSVTVPGAVVRTRTGYWAR